jgi:hypothetical protein
MSHVDEGVLHALLDGAYEEGDAEREALEAHLATCADCRVRLVDARRIKQRAHSALGRLAPESIAVPSFDTVVAERATRSQSGGGTGTASRVRRRPWTPMAWAASLMLAVGAGWMANQLFDASRTPAQLEQMRADAMTSPAESVTEPVGQMLDQVQAPPPAAPVAETRERDMRSTDPDVAVASGAVPPPADAAGRRGEPPTVSADVARVAAASTIQRLNAAEKSSAPLLGSSVMDSLRGLAPRQEAAAPADPVDALLRDYADATATEQWRTVSAAEATERLSRAPAALDGIVPDSVELAEIGGRVLVRVTNQIDDSLRVEIVQRGPVGLAMQGRIGGAGRGGRGGGRLGQQGQQALGLQSRRAEEMEHAPLRTLGDVRVAPIPVPGLPTVFVLVNAPEETAREMAARVR